MYVYKITRCDFIQTKTFTCIWIVVPMAFRIKIQMHIFVNVLPYIIYIYSTIVTHKRNPDVEKIYIYVVVNNVLNVYLTHLDSDRKSERYITALVTGNEEVIGYQYFCLNSHTNLKHMKRNTFDVPICC